VEGGVKRGGKKNVRVSEPKDKGRRMSKRPHTTRKTRTWTGKERKNCRRSDRCITGVANGEGRTPTEKMLKTITFTPRLSETRGPEIKRCFTKRYLWDVDPSQTGEDTSFGSKLKNKKGEERPPRRGQEGVTPRKEIHGNIKQKKGQKEKANQSGATKRHWNLSGACWRGGEKVRK